MADDAYGCPNTRTEAVHNANTERRVTACLLPNNESPDTFDECLHLGEPAHSSDGAKQIQYVDSRPLGSDSPS